MNRTSQIVTFKLSILSTWLLCITANSFASDIEIYKAPTLADGKARVMLNLDNSTYMSGEPSGTSSPSTIKEDFGSSLDCTPSSNNANGNKKYYTGRETRDYPSGASYTYDTAYCKISTTDAVASAKKVAIQKF